MASKITIDLVEGNWIWTAELNGKIVGNGSTEIGRWIAECQAGRALRDAAKCDEPGRCPSCNSLHLGRGECRSCYREYLQPRGERSWDD